MKNFTCCALLLFAPGGIAASPQEAAKAVYKDADAAIPARVHDLLVRMTLEEKVAQLESQWVLSVLGPTKMSSIFEGDRVNDAKVRKFAANGLGTYSFSDEFNGASPADPRFGAKRRNLLQAWIIKNTRLGIPILFHGEALHGAVVPGATNFPAAVGLGSTWDPELIETMFSAVALESRAAGNALVLAPVLDLSRDPRFGRVEEMYSEDPYLVAKMGVAAVRGLQGTEDRVDQSHVFATAKHFVHGQPENGTNAGPSDFSERTMRTYFLYPFEEVVKKAHVAAVLPSYNTTSGGVPSTGNPWLLKEVLRKEWGFTGITTSDYFAIPELASRQHVAADTAAAGLLAFKSGVDMELPASSAFPSLVDAVKAGKLDQKEIDEAVGRVLTAKFRAGLFEHPYVDEERAAAEVGSKERVKLARHVADEAIVLLQNNGNALPLKTGAMKAIAVIGPNGKKERLGGYSSLPPYYVSIVDGIQARAGAGVKVSYAEGCRISEPDQGPNFDMTAVYKAPTEEADRKLIQEAIETAKSADLIVLALGGNETVSREALTKSIAGDSDTLELPGRQNELVQEIAKLGKPIVAVLLNGRPYSIQQLAAKVPAILEGWYLGQETGNAIAGVLFGDVNPSGHLPVTIARNVGQLPVYYYKEPAARRAYVFDDNSPLFPFGFGLSYTSFSFKSPVLDRDHISPGEAAKVSVEVTNTGSRAGDEVVQLYIHHPVSSVVQPVIALRGFKRVHLDAGSSTTVSFVVGPEELAIWDLQIKRTVEPGPVDLLLGASSAETSSVRLTITEPKQDRW